VPGRIVTARSISSTVRFHCVDDALAEKFDFLTAEPELTEPLCRHYDIKTIAVQDAYYDFADPHRGQPGTSGHLLNRAHMILRKVMLEETRG